MSYMNVINVNIHVCMSYMNVINLDMHVCMSYLCGFKEDMHVCISYMGGKQFFCVSASNNDKAALLLAFIIKV